MIGIIVSGQGGPDRRQDGSDRALGQPELPPEPLDAVREQLGARQDDDERAEQDEEFHGPLSLSCDERIRCGGPIGLGASDRGSETSN